MSRELALSLLNKGNTGSDILKILDTITRDIEQVKRARLDAISMPTMNTIEF